MRELSGYWNHMFKVFITTSCTRVPVVMFNHQYKLSSQLLPLFLLKFLVNTKKGIPVTEKLTLFICSR